MFLRPHITQILGIQNVTLHRTRRASCVTFKRFWTYPSKCDIGYTQISAQVDTSKFNVGRDALQSQNIRSGLTRNERQLSLGWKSIVICEIWGSYGSCCEDIRLLEYDVVQSSINVTTYQMKRLPPSSG